MAFKFGYGTGVCVIQPLVKRGSIWKSIHLDIYDARVPIVTASSWRYNMYEDRHCLLCLVYFTGTVFPFEEGATTCKSVAYIFY